MKATIIKKVFYSRLILFASVLLPALSATAQENTPLLNQTAPGGTLPPSIPIPPTTDLYHYNRIKVHKVLKHVDDPMNVFWGGNNTVSQTTSIYRDGFNRTSFAVTRDFARENGQQLKDLVQIKDHHVRPEQRNYLPYSSVSGDASVLTGHAFEAQQDYYINKYPGEGYTAFSVGRCHSTASLRQSRKYLPGKSQVGQGRFISTTSITNAAGAVRIWQQGSNGSLTVSGAYGAGELFGTRVRSQEGNKTITFKNKEGHLVLKRVQDGASSYTETYYVYDEMGHLCYIIPPKATQYAKNHSWNLPASVVDDLCFQYQFDSKGRLIAQRYPGQGGFTRIVYDHNQRAAMRQTPAEKQDGVWEVTFYDHMGRVIATSRYSSPMSREDAQAMLDSYPNTSYSPSDIRYYLLSEEGAGTYPPESGISGNVMMSYMWYDDYRISDPGHQWLNQSLGILSFTETVTTLGAETPEISYRTKGLVTGTKVRILPAPGIDTATTGAWRQSVSYYDDKGRVIYAASRDLFHNTVVHAHFTATQYDFLNRVRVVKHIARNYNSEDGQTSHTELTRNYYDAVTTRLLKSEHRMDGGPWHTLSQYTYNDLGRVKQEILGNNGEIRNYTYNIRGQLTGINGHYAETGEKNGQSLSYGESLKYDYGFTQPRYDGKIAGIIWRGSGKYMQAYGYVYDHNGRLDRADYRQYREMPVSSGNYQWDKTIDDRSVKNIAYDKNGNLLSMTQRGTRFLSGGQLGQTATDIDHLTYHYAAHSNRLMSVTDTVSINYHVGDFQDGNKDGADYAYDIMGNLSKDKNKGITQVSYTYFNKPKTISFANGNTIKYSYTASGGKVQEHIVDTTSLKTTDYNGNFIYKNDSLQYTLTSVGRTVWYNDTAKEEFFVKDHLGNVRTVIDEYEYPILEYLATYEIASANLENLFFEKINEVRDDKPEQTDPEDTKSARLNGADPERRVGTSILMKVMAGDKIQMNVNSYYEGYNPEEDRPVSAEDMLVSIVSTLTGGQGGLGESESHNPELVNKLFTPENYLKANDIFQSESDPNKPKAFLKYILFDERMQVVSSFTGAFQATGNGDWTAIGDNLPHEIPCNGYLVVYLENESVSDVFFDALELQFTRGALKEETHYYPFGLPMGDIGSHAVGFKANRYRYQSNEYITEAGLNWMSFGARQYDPQIGRFLSVDPLAAAHGQDQFSPYAAMGNEPAGMVDPNGELFRGPLHFTVAAGPLMPARLPGANFYRIMALGLKGGGRNWTASGPGGGGGGSSSEGMSELAGIVITNVLNSTFEQMLKAAFTFANFGGGGDGETATNFESYIDGDQKVHDSNIDMDLQAIYADDKGNGDSQKSDNGDSKSPLQEMKDNPPNHPDYKAPKSGPRKVLTPRGKGWIDKKGRVWVPDTHKGNEAPHWDVQNPNGKRGYTKIYPVVSTAVKVGIGVTIGIAIWETVKWGAAILGAPETGGTSLGLLALP